MPSYISLAKEVTVEAIRNPGPSAFNTGCSVSSAFGRRLGLFNGVSRRELQGELIEGRRR